MHSNRAIEVAGALLMMVSAAQAASDARYPDWKGAWERFAAPLFVMLPAEPETIDGWWRAVRASALTERQYV